jgi:hypothetical protein
MKVDRTYRAEKADKRIIRCMSCQAEYIEESRIIGAYKRDPDRDSFYPSNAAEVEIVHIVTIGRRDVQ